MNTGVQVKIEGLDKIQKAFNNAPQIAGPIFARSINASLFLIQKYAIDEFFQFKLPRSKRTGLLAVTFGLPSNGGLKLATAESLSGYIGPTRKYAPYVYYGTSRMSPNPFIDRMVDKSVVEVNQVFKDALDQITNQLTN